MNRKQLAKFGCLPVAVIAGIAIAMGSGDSDNDETDDAKPKATVTATASVAKDTHSTEETAFLLTTRNKIPALKKVPDKQILDLGHSSCDAIDAGNSPAAVAARAEEGLQIGAENSAYIVGAAVSQFCPEHEDQL
ncbi:DUF732 domain-containing protein [Streptomyces tendae]|uniref:DUF732 domain-containing protein n=1 Tax=Streptomyces tendae TaxID=1932 RepID=UPI003800B3EC